MWKIDRKINYGINIYIVSVKVIILIYIYRKGVDLRENK